MSGRDSQPTLLATEQKNETFVREVAAVINRLSLENGSNTPDYLLAGYLWDCLQAFNATVYCRDKRHPLRPTADVETPE